MGKYKVLPFFAHMTTIDLFFGRTYKGLAGSDPKQING
jgi:hypothetical protein